MFSHVGLLYFVSSLSFIASQSVNPDVLLNLVSITLFLKSVCNKNCPGSTNTKTWLSC